MHLQILDSYVHIAKFNAPFSPGTSTLICLSYLQAYIAVFLISKHPVVGTLSQQMQGKF